MLYMYAARRHVSACTIRCTSRARDAVRFMFIFFPSDSKYKRVYNLMILYLLFSLQKYVREYFALLFCIWFSFFIFSLFLFLNKTAIVLKIKYEARQFLQREREREEGYGYTVLSACANECASVHCS